MKRSQVLRILDANFNRSREGLRVCEEIARFVLEEKTLTRRLKKMRHGVSACFKQIPVSSKELMASRDTRSDVGKKPLGSEKIRRDAWDLFSANIERVKESLRVLEETSKFLDTPLSGSFKTLRFEAYAVEKKALPKLEALRDCGRRGFERP